MKLFSYFFICNFLHISHQILAIFLEMFVMEYFCPIDVMRLGSTPLVATVSGLMTIVVYCDLFLMISEMVGCFNLSLLSKKWSHFFLFPKLELQCFCVFASTYTTTQVNCTSRWPPAFHFCCVSGPDPGPFHQKQLWQTEEWCLSESGHAGSQSL